MTFDAVAPLILSFAGSASSSVLFNVPRRAILPCGIAGNVAWFGFLGFQATGMSEPAATFLAAFLVAMASEILARIMRMPTSCFSVPGVIPLVPGLYAYHATFGFVNNQYAEGSSYAIRTLLVAAAIGAGLVMAGSLFRMKTGTRLKTDRPHPPAPPAGPESPGDSG